MEKRPSVLIIETRQSTRTLLEMTLTHEGLRVFSAVNLDSALLQLRVLHPDLIIVGLAREELEKSSALSQIKALSLSPILALGDGENVTSGAGIAAAPPCPDSGEQLCAKVEGLLGRLQLCPRRLNQDE